jgi:ubiquinone/menaquinone biosynthesis C-methylase UbiE
MTAWSQKRQTMRRYNQSAHVYDTQYSEEQAVKFKTVMQGLRLSHKSRILDLGCGTGLILDHLVGRAELTVGVDISRGLLEEARKKARPYLHVLLVLADADNLPFVDHVFNAVLAITLLQNMPNPRATLDEIKRVSKQTASIVVTGLKKRFTKDDFAEMMKRADLTIDTLKLDEKNREYVCVCRKA